ncbi:unnamed protein product [Cylindrotheca closterium]|uniref:Uncharacterized protein n=1 Tax=Cylindrotheca closterium TaxID=2856 RepID=A0AAD2CRW7_9STRA|nr:unnamed protein product [Cylindrotheca closterium]
MATENLASSQAPPDLRSLSSLTDSDTEELDDCGTMKNTSQWLHHCIEYQGTKPYVVPSLEDHRKAIELIIADQGNNIQDRDSVGVHVTNVSKDESFDFDSVHHLPLPSLVELWPVVLDMVYQEGSDRCFVRIKCDLNSMDGVTALHAGLNLLEYMESGKISPYPFTASNPPLPANQFENFQNQLGRVEQGKLMAKTSGEPGVWTRSPFMHEFEDTFSERPSRRYTSVDVSFKTIMKRIDEAKQILNIPFYAVTVNYSPAVALSISPTLEEAMDRKKRASNIALPPDGTGAPAPMNAAHVEMLFNTIFLNNYGKHGARRLIGKVVGYTWDWSGMLKSFAPFFHIVQIQDKLFFRMSASPPDMRVLEESKLFDDIGKFQSFKELPFYSSKKC